MLAMLRQTLGKARIVSGERICQYAPHHVGEVVDADNSGAFSIFGFKYSNERK